MTRRGFQVHGKGGRAAAEGRRADARGIDGGKQLGLALGGLRDAKEMLGYEDLSINTKVAKVSIVGAGMASATGVASKMFEALAMAGINIRMISVLINEGDSEKAVKAIHEEFFNA